MAQNSNTQVPDLASVLRTLASLASAGTQQPPQQPSQHPVIQEQYTASHAYDPTQYHKTPQSFPALAQPNPVHPFGVAESHRPDPQHRRSIQNLHRSTPTPPLIDPATIIEWSQGLRCVSKIAAQNPNFKAAIRKLISDQESHERMWWRGKEALMEKQAARSRNNGKQNEAMLSTNVSNETPLATPEEDEAELKEYDKKVHKATREMVDVMSLELKRLGVPFFGVKPDLILPPGIKKPEAQDKSLPQTVNVPAPQKITEDELLGLQRRMLEYLEDMYRE